MQAPVPSAGTAVWIRRRRWRVERVSVEGPVLRLEVAGREGRFTFLAPFDRPTPAHRGARPRHARQRSAMARLAGLAAQSAGLRTPCAAVHARVALLPHQLDPVAAMLDGARRVLIADEVGLGKTIQAGLVVAELSRRDAAATMLILLPSALRSQWAEELRSRFGLHASVADRESIAAAMRSAWRGENAWRQARLWIASMDFLKQPHVAASLPRTPWDLIVVDEAHEACGDSERHDACAAILRRARRVLLLTATPHSGDVARFHRLIDLGRLESLDDRLVVFRRTRADLGWPAARNVRWTPVTLPPPQARTLDALATFERHVLASAGAGRRDAALLFLSVLRKRALSTMAALVRTLQHRLDWLAASSAGQAPDWLQPRLSFEEDAGADDVGPEERASLMAEIGLDPRRERAWLSRLLGLAADALPQDGKIHRLVVLLRRASEPAVVFTEFRDSLDALRGRLVGLATAVLHGGQGPSDRAAELDRFLNGSARLLLATDVASQGLNLQSRARWVISLELPWNPARLAQRIGRVDRIGQTRRVHATLLVARHSAEMGVLRRLAERTLAARRAVGAAALQDAAPPDHVCLAAAVVENAADTAPAQPPAPPAMDPGRARGRAIAHLLARKRRLAGRWRGPLDGFRPLSATLGPSGEHSIAGCEAVAIFSTPIVNRAGVVIEPQVVAIGFRTVPPARGLNAPELLAWVGDVARTRLRARLARLRRLFRAVSRHAAAVDRAIAEELAFAERGGMQAGLFAPGSATARAAETRQLEDQAQREQARRRSMADDLELAVAAPVLQALLQRRPQ
jgi:superfamily II DNA or RNA helicase